MQAAQSSSGCATASLSSPTMAISSSIAPADRSTSRRNSRTPCPSIPGVVEHGLFIGMASIALVGSDIWRNRADAQIRMSGFDYDLFVIGAGSGGVRAARVAARHGAKVAVAEEYRVGGTCVIRGCVPKKLLVYASKYAEEFEDAVGFGWTSEKVSFDWPTLIANKDKEIERLSRAYIRNLESAGAELIMGRAVLEDRHTIRLGDRRITARIILIATGADKLRAAASCPAMNWRLPPTKRSISIACRRASASSAAVTSRSNSPASSRASASKPFSSIAARRSCAVSMTICAITSTAEMREEGHRDQDEGRRRADRSLRRWRARDLEDGTAFGAGQIMFATGRIPECHGSRPGSRRRRTDTPLCRQGRWLFARRSVDNIYAVGDVTNRVNLTPVAIREGQAFADTVFGGKDIRVDHANIPTAVFSQPEIGTVGLTEARRAPGLSLGRYLQDDVQADAAHAFRPRRAHADEAGRRCRERPRTRLPHLRTGCRAKWPSFWALPSRWGRPRPISTPPWRSIRLRLRNW